ncbi:unnamed protein product [Symbiodinium sp. CCMP2592]|nr:unnamed protein product [Symbiodinium sp. CCMP2592]
MDAYGKQSPSNKSIQHFSDQSYSESSTSTSDAGSILGLLEDAFLRYHEAREAKAKAERAIGVGDTEHPEEPAALEEALPNLLRPLRAPVHNGLCGACSQAQSVGHSNTELNHLPEHKSEVGVLKKAYTNKTRKEMEKLRRAARAQEMARRRAARAAQKSRKP